MIRVDFNKAIGRIKPMHAVGQPPFLGGYLKFDFSHMDWLTQANVPYSRLHDVGGTYGANRFVDIPNLFRDFDADETDADNYDFAFTDVLIEAMLKYNLKPIFRLGVSIETQSHIKAYRINPPKDYAKWARICEHVIRHYNYGWANGFNYGIEYWEIWNEADNGIQGKNPMWTGTPQEFYELYDVSAKHLKSVFGDEIKVGGYGASGFYGVLYHPEKYGVDAPAIPIGDKYENHIYRVEFLNGFLDYIEKSKAPLDFFSWHSYETVEHTNILADYLDRVMTAHGFGEVETHLNEWNTAYLRSNMMTSFASASAIAMMCSMQGKKTQMLCYYDAKLATSVYGGLFNYYTLKPTCTYYALRAFGELYALGTQAECINDSESLYTLAATDGSNNAVLISNLGEDTPVCLCGTKGLSVYLIDSDCFMQKTDLDPENFILKKNQAAIIK